ncbi:MAG: haloacid dehalogenase type II [Gammaproteobacteria bacterium]|nr:haloacid dehalogenase type II [Gammaproteobacteria bacterium]
MSITLAFDVYGTLINTHGIVSKLMQFSVANAEQFSQLWRDKQLEYSFRRGLMQSYENFAVCTSNALDYSCSYLGVSLSDEQKNELLTSYRRLPAFDDVIPALQQLKNAGYNLYAFSNGTATAVEELLTSAGISDYFLGVVSVDEIKTFKPNPATYQHFLTKSAATCSSAWLISSNPFDVIGAVSAGMKSAWVKRNSDAVFDPWGIDPTVIISKLSELEQHVAL